jgi:hypothetical protein
LLLLARILANAATDRRGAMDLDEIERKASQSQHELTEIKATVRQLVERVDRQALVIGVLKEMLLAGSAISSPDWHRPSFGRRKTKSAGSAASR